MTITATAPAITGAFDRASFWILVVASEYPERVGWIVGVAAEIVDTARSTGPVLVPDLARGAAPGRQ